MEVPLWKWLNFSPFWLRFLEPGMPQSRIQGPYTFLDCFSTLGYQSPALQRSVGKLSPAQEQSQRQLSPAFQQSQGPQSPAIAGSLGYQNPLSRNSLWYQSPALQ